MMFQELPTEVQIIAAQLLAEKIRDNDRCKDKEPVTELAREVRDAFIAIYSPQQCVSAHCGSDQELQ